MDLNHLFIFKKVVEAGGFSAAAQELKLPKSSVSQKVGQLEQELGVRLLQRTTRRVSVTEVGEKVYDASLRIAAESDEIQALAEGSLDEPSGLLRLTAPHDLGIYVIHRVMRPFLDRYPKMTLEIDLSGRFVDLVKEGIDLALRASSGPLKESSLVARSMLKMHMRLFASPAWCARHGTPKTPKDLEGVASAQFTSARRTLTAWSLTSKTGQADIAMRPVFRANDLLAVKQAAISGIGPALLPSFLCDDDVAKKELVPLLPAWEAGEATFYLVYPSRRHIPAKTRAFVEFLQTTMEGLR